MIGAMVLGAMPFVPFAGFGNVMIAESPRGVVVGLRWREPGRTDVMELYQVLRLRNGQVFEMQDFDEAKAVAESRRQDALTDAYTRFGKAIDHMDRNIPSAWRLQGSPLTL